MQCFQSVPRANRWLDPALFAAVIRTHPTTLMDIFVVRVLFFVRILRCRFIAGVKSTEAVKCVYLPTMVRADTLSIVADRFWTVRFKRPVSYRSKTIIITIIIIGRD